MGGSSKARNSIRSAVSQHSGNSRSKQMWFSRVSVGVVFIMLLGLLGSWWGGGFTQPQAVAELHSMVDDEVARLARVARNEIPYGSSGPDMGEWFQKFRDVPEKYRGQIRQDMGRLFTARERAATQSYFALPPEQRRAEMDRRIKAEEARSKERRERWAAERAAREQANANGQTAENGRNGGGQEGRGRGPNAGGESGRGGQRTEDTRNDWMKRRLDNSSPDERALRTEYRRAMNERREQLGMEPGRGGGPPGRRGPPGGRPS
jgi:hypothetical protein